MFRQVNNIFMKITHQSPKYNETTTYLSIRLLVYYKFN